MPPNPQTQPDGAKDQRAGINDEGNRHMEPEDNGVTSRITAWGPVFVHWLPAQGKDTRANGINDHPHTHESDKEHRGKNRAVAIASTFR
jgi:hypothetical protein